MVSASSNDLQPGTEVAGFRIEGVLGRGSRAVVYEATQLGLDRRVALKIFRPGALPEERLHALRWPEHPNVVRLYAAGMSEHGPFLALQLVDGPTLDEPAGRRNVRRVLRDVRAALEAAHATGHVHGSVAGRNVFVDGSGRALVTDFGLGSPELTIDDDAAAYAGLLDAFPRRSKRSTALVSVGAAAAGAVVIAVAVSMSGGAEAAPPVLEGAVALGSALRSADVRSVDCNANPPSGSSPTCGVAQTTLPGRAVTPQRPGVIKRWVVRGARGQLALEVLRPRGSTYFMVARTQYTTIEDGALHALPANLPVRPGDLVGLIVTPGAAVGIRAGTDGAKTFRWFGPVIYEARPPERVAGSGFDDELLLRVEYIPGATWHIPGELTGHAAAAAPSGRVAGRLVLRRGANRAALVVVRVGGAVAVDFVVVNRRLVRLPIQDARPDGHLDALTIQIDRFGKPVVRVLWRNPDGVVAHEYVAGERTLTTLG